MSMSKWIQHLKMLRWDRVQPPENESAPSIIVRQDWQPNAEHLEAFLSLCPGWRHRGFLPPTYPQVAVANTHLEVLAARNFPYNPMGIVHMSNRIEVARPLPAEHGPYQVEVSLGNWQAHRRGKSFDIETTLTDSGEIHWRSVARALVMNSSGAKHTRPKGTRPADESSEVVPEDCYSLPENLGRRYAKIAGDYNPIHQRAWMARPFGFKRAIIHGMWTLAWAVHEPASRHEPGALSIEGHFKRPIPLPSEIYRSTAAAPNGGIEISIWRRGALIPCLAVILT